MKPTRLAILVITVSTLLAAEPICRHLVFPAVHKHHSKDTIKKWTAYNAQHHINPKAKEILAELDIICAEVKTQGVDQVGFLLLTEPPQWTDVEVTPPVDNLIPDAPQIVSNVSFQLPTSTTQPPIAEAPEPASLILLGTGFFFLAFITIQRKEQCTV